MLRSSEKGDVTTPSPVGKPLPAAPPPPCELMLPGRTPLFLELWESISIRRRSLLITALPQPLQ